MNWLFKEEPANYSFDALVKDKKTVWSGVKNPLAQKHLRSVRKGDGIFYYHTGDQKAVVGIAEVAATAYPDKTAKEGDWSAVDLVPHKALVRPVTLDEVKTIPKLKEMALLRYSRLSVQPVTADEFTEIIRMSGGK